jgi:hypothetical protein
MTQVHLFLGNDDGDGANILVIVEYCMSVLKLINILLLVNVLKLVILVEYEYVE